MFSLHGAMGEQAHLLDHVADLPAQLAGLAVEDAAAAQEDVPAAERDHPVDQTHRRRLARAGRANEDAHLAGGNGQGQVVDGRLALTRVTLAHVSQLELGCLRER